MLQRTLPAGCIAPCLPTKTDKLPSGGQWLHEIKHDGAVDRRPRSHHLRHRARFREFCGAVRAIQRSGVMRTSASDCRAIGFVSRAPSETVPVGLSGTWERLQPRPGNHGRQLSCSGCANLAVAQPRPGLIQQRRNGGARVRFENAVVRGEGSKYRTRRRHVQSRHVAAVQILRAVCRGRRAVPASRHAARPRRTGAGDLFAAQARLGKPPIRRTARRRLRHARPVARRYRPHHEGHAMDAPMLRGTK